MARSMTELRDWLPPHLADDVRALFYAIFDAYSDACFVIEYVREHRGYRVHTLARYWPVEFPADTNDRPRTTVHSRELCGPLDTVLTEVRMFAKLLLEETTDHGTVYLGENLHELVRGANTVADFRRQVDSLPFLRGSTTH